MTLGAALDQLVETVQSHGPAINMNRQSLDGLGQILQNLTSRLTAVEQILTTQAQSNPGLHLPPGATRG